MVDENASSSIVTINVGSSHIRFEIDIDVVYNLFCLIFLLLIGSNSNIFINTQ